MSDLIERDAILKRLKDPELQRFFGKKIPDHAVNWAVLAVNKAPAVEAEVVRRGRWITRGRWVHCSECQTNGSPRWKRCPLCEARMEGE